MMTCEEMRAKLADYAVGLPDEPIRVEIEQHLETCPDCAEELMLLERTGLLIDALELKEAPVYLWDAIECRIMTESPRSGRWWDVFSLTRMPRTAWAGMAVTMIVILALFLALVRPVRTVDDQAGSFIERHGMLAWNDPLSDKAALGAVVGASMMREDIP